MNKFNTLAFASLTALMVGQAAQAAAGSITASGTVSLSVSNSCVFYIGSSNSTSASGINLNLGTNLQASILNTTSLSTSASLTVRCNSGTAPYFGSPGNPTTSSSLSLVGTGSNSTTIPTTVSSSLSSSLAPVPSGSLYTLGITATTSSIDWFTIPTDTYSNTYTVSVNF